MNETIETVKKSFYRVAEFATLFGKDRSWAYRLLYAGKIQAITGYGETMIPQSEYDRLLNDKQRYMGRRKKRHALGGAES